jgi:hypothetical protein
VVAGITGDIETGSTGIGNDIKIGPGKAGSKMKKNKAVCKDLGHGFPLPLGFPAAGVWPGNHGSVAQFPSLKSSVFIGMTLIKATCPEDI